MLDRAASVAAFGDWCAPMMLKHQADLDRYARVIAETRPQVVVETGTHTGEAAQWFASQPSVAEVFTIDVNNRDDMDQRGDNARVCFVRGDSADHAVVALVAGLVNSRRCMVSLDSDHSAGHVRREIELYGPLVSAGCYLVVEDGILAWLDADTRRAHVPGQMGSPLEAIDAVLAGAPQFERDLTIENMSPVSMFPAGWWRKVAR